jgi:hypothetical protein
VAWLAIASRNFGCVQKAAIIGRRSEGEFANGTIIGSASASVPSVIRETLKRANPSASKPTRAEMRRTKHVLGIRTGIPGRGKEIPNKTSGKMRSLFSLFSSDLAIDLGTANTLVFSRGKGIVVNEPSIVAINKVRGDVVAVGREAKEMLGRTPGNVVAIKPMKDGVIADFKITEKMLTYFIQKAHNRRVLVRPRIVIGVPSEITPVEKRAVQDSAYNARASEVYLVEQARRRRSVRVCQSESLWETWW